MPVCISTDWLFWDAGFSIIGSVAAVKLAELSFLALIVGRV
jgi:hypothetical protein